MSDKEALSTRQTASPTTVMIIDGVPVMLTAWSMYESVPFFLEFTDYPSVIKWLLGAVVPGAEADIIGVAGNRTHVKFGDAPAPSWLPAQRDAVSQLDVAVWSAAPIGRLMREQRSLVADASSAQTLREAVQPLSLVLDTTTRPCLMVAAPQTLSAASDDLALARMFAGLLKDNYQLPIAASDDLALGLWRDLRVGDQVIAEVGDDLIGPVGVVDMDGNEVDGEGTGAPAENGLALSWVQPGFGFGARTWLISGGIGAAVNAISKRLATSGALADMLAITAAERTWVGINEEEDA